MNKHKCIKCGAEYEDNDPDDYYCAVCNEQRKVLAAEIDAKLKTRKSTREVKSTFSPKDFVGRSGRMFFNANDI